jgi:hypothetical protein
MPPARFTSTTERSKNVGEKEATVDCSIYITLTDELEYYLEKLFIIGKLLEGTTTPLSQPPSPYRKAC